VSLQAWVHRVQGRDLKGRGSYTRMAVEHQRIASWFVTYRNNTCLLRQLMLTISRPKTIQFYPLFMVFPAPFLFESVYVAHFSSFNRFCSSFSAPKTVPSSSAASSSSSLSVGASYDACLAYQRGRQVRSLMRVLTLLQ
jgi:hypothetical protein